MDLNTATVLNSVLNIIAIIVSGLMVVYINKSNKKIDTVKTEVDTVKGKVDTVTGKLDENHKLVNGHLSALLQTTKDLATANERARADAETKHKKH